ncbi:DUF4184 family protein [Noviherbaspirillum sp.]|uniref:DUF4184 family protein n=1 Tax=Noviherbaspirillum sp. TaxID=1926288 RepID=UPI002FE08EE9
MPFTLSHPAAIVPIKRYWKGADLSALVIGSMAPDFVYFLRIGISGPVSHSLSGIVSFCVPASLAAYLIFHLLIKHPLWLLLPDFLRERLDIHSPGWLPASPGSWAVVIASAALGAATHVAWDSFTHANTHVVTHWSWLRSMIGPDGGPRIPLYKVLQHASTVFGLWILAAALRKWFNAAPVHRHRANHLSPNVRTAVVLVLLISGSLGLMVGAMNVPDAALERMIFKGIVEGVQWFAVATFLYCVVMHTYSAVRRNDA